MESRKQRTPSESRVYRDILVIYRLQGSFLKVDPVLMRLPLQYAAFNFVSVNILVIWNSN
jgi:hypothetical protein